MDNHLFRQQGNLNRLLSRVNACVDGACKGQVNGLTGLDAIQYGFLGVGCPRQDGQRLQDNPLRAMCS